MCSVLSPHLTSPHPTPPHLITRLPITSQDLEFLESVQKLLQRALQAITTRAQQGDLVTSTLNEIRALCSRWASIPRGTLFNLVADRVNQVYFSANLYVARPGPMGAQIHFFLASPKSHMVGKVLNRSHPIPPITIAAMDSKTSVAVTPQMEDGALAERCVAYCVLGARALGVYCLICPPSL